MKSVPDTTNDAIEIVADHIDVSVEEIKQSVDRVLSSSLFWFPVRHHSPVVARYLKRAIEKRKPKMLFIEGPAEANHLVKHIVDSDTKPPVAIYSSYRDDDNVLNLAGILSAAKDIPPRFSAWYPMLSYSPEYVAMTVAKKIKADVTFIDLPHHALLKPFAPAGDAHETGTDSSAATESDHPNSDTSATTESDQTDTGASATTESGQTDTGVSATTESDQTDTGASATTESDQTDTGASATTESEQTETDADVASGSEKLMAGSSFFQKLAEVAGYRTFDEAWDSLFEIRDFNDDVEFFRREVATFCAAARATSSKYHVAHDGTLERERHMMKVIKETMQAKNLKDEDCMVICGGFHLFLDYDDQAAPPESPAGTVYTTVVPYSFFRFSELSGYGAGNRAPQYYQTMWDLRERENSQDLLIEHVVNTLKQARREGEPLSSADAISTCQHAEMLARLRGRSVPILDDIHDALITCCCKGDPDDVGLHLMKAMTAVDIGTKIGRVTAALGQLPIVNDFYKQVDVLHLDECMSKEQLFKIKVDKRIEQERRQSVFLHRLLWLEVGMVSLLESTASDLTSGTLFLERWGLRWSPQVEAKLVECNLYGDTIESASLARFREKMAEVEMQADVTSKLLLDVLNIDLPNVVREVETVLSKAIDNDSRFPSLGRTLANLITLEQYGVYRGMKKGVVDELIERCFDRACFAIIDVISVPEEQQNEVVTGLLTLAEILQRGDRPDLDRNLFVEHLRNAATACDVPFMRGVLLGLLTELRINTIDDLARELSALAKAPVEIMITSGDFLDGIMAASRTSIMLGATALIAAIDELLRAAEWDPFLTMVPKMRAAFERLHSAQRDNVADQVAKKYGLKEGETLTELRTSLEGAAMIVSIDNQVSQIMSKWDF